MTIDTLAKILKVGGITNIIGSAPIAVFYHWLATTQHQSSNGFPVWLYSFFYCTTILGLVYIHAARDPVKYRPFIGIAAIAKLWGVLATLYAVLGDYPWLLLVAVYDIAYGAFFYALYRRVPAADHAAAAR
jgi:hypothetical protein